MNQQNFSKMIGLILILSLCLAMFSGIIFMLISALNDVDSDYYLITDEKINVSCFDKERSFITNQICHPTKDIFCDGFIKSWEDKECKSLKDYKILEEIKR